MSAEETTPAPIHPVGALDWYGDLKVKILADTGRRVTMEALETKGGYTRGDVIMRNYAQPVFP